MFVFFADAALPMDEQKSSHLFFNIPMKTFNPLAIVTVRTGKSPEKYSELVCSEEDVKNIQELIETLGSHGKIDLFLHYEKKLRSIEQKIRHVHPLKFLAVIFRNPTLKSHMKKVYGDFFIQRNFLENLSVNLDVEMEKRKVYPFLTDFCKEVHYDEVNVKPFIDGKDWKGLLNYLIYTNENPTL